MQENIDALSTRLGQLLTARKGWLATAESCTGGLLSGAVTAIAGSSGWFDQGWVTYSNEAKHMQLGVTHACLKEFGAVSEQTAREMAAGVLAMAPRATLALTTTGIAGPGGGTADKPVGLVWFGVLLVWACKSGASICNHAKHTTITHISDFLYINPMHSL